MRKNSKAKKASSKTAKKTKAVVAYITVKGRDYKIDLSRFYSHNG